MEQFKAQKKERNDKSRPKLQALTILRSFAYWTRELWTFGRTNAREFHPIVGAFHINQYIPARSGEHRNCYVLAREKYTLRPKCLETRLLEMYFWGFLFDKSVKSIGYILSIYITSYGNLQVPRLPGLNRFDG